MANRNTKRNNNPFLFLLFLTGFCIQSCSPSQGKLNGSIFVVTKGAESIKLGLVTVYVFGEQEAQAHITRVDLLTETRLLAVRHRRDELLNQHTAAAEALKETRAKYVTAKQFADEAVKRYNLELQTFTTAPPSGESFEELGVARPEDVYTEKLREAGRDYLAARADFVRFGSLFSYRGDDAKDIEANYQAKIASLSRLKPEYQKRQKLYDKWMPIWQKHLEESQKLPEQTTYFADEVRRLSGAMETQRRILKNWPTSVAKDYLENLPVPVTVTKTDADGKFSVAVPRKGRFAVAAQAQRKVGSDTEQYCWLVWVSLNGMPAKELFLSNDNMLPTGSPDSAVHLVVP